MKHLSKSNDSIFLFFDLFRFYVCLVVCCCFLCVWGGGAVIVIFLQNQTLYELFFVCLQFNHYLQLMSNNLENVWIIIAFSQHWITKTGRHTIMMMEQAIELTIPPNDDSNYYTCSRYLIISCKCIWYIRFNLNAFNFHNFNRNT